jgi:hypothetical protein
MNEFAQMNHKKISGKDADAEQKKMSIVGFEREHCKKLLTQRKRHNKVDQNDHTLIVTSIH